MADEETSALEQEDRSIWETIGMDPPEEDEFETETVEAEAEAEDDDKLAKKLSNRVDNLEKKFRQERLQQIKEKYLENAEPLERDLFKAIAGDVKDPETLDHAITLVRERAEQMKKTQEQYEAEARKQVEKSWGVANPGQTPAPSEDEEKSQQEAIANGDSKAAFAALMSDEEFLR